MRGKTIPWDNVVYYEMEHTRAIRTEQWKYVHRYGYGFNELYDLRNDPDERENLAEVPSRQPRVRELRDRLEAGILASAPS